MEKMILDNTMDRDRAISFFGYKYKHDIKNEVTEYPCMLIAYKSNNEYSFSTIMKSDFDNPSSEIFN